MAEQPVCAFCRAHPVDPRWRPFCSERCRLQDLARWADGSYRVAADQVGDAEERESEKDKGES
jgi:endogenous inhibitor of DNA gyrase (YacG/DUF329 family)